MFWPLYLHNSLRSITRRIRRSPRLDVRCLMVSMLLLCLDIISFGSVSSALFRYRCFALTLTSRGLSRVEILERRRCLALVPINFLVMCNWRIVTIEYRPHYSRSCRSSGFVLVLIQQVATSGESDDGYSYTDKRCFVHKLALLLLWASWKQLLMALPVLLLD